MSFTPKAISFLKTDLGIALLLTIAWSLLMTAIGFIVDNSSLLSHTVRWDSNWYLIVTGDWYHTNLASAAFYPLFPLLVSIVHTVSFGVIDMLTAGALVNVTALWFTLTALIKIGRELLGKKYAYRLALLLLIFPTAFFLHAFYGEAVFLALGCWAYYFALKRRWLFMAILLAFLSATRLPAILFIALCGLEFFRAYGWSIRKIFNKNLLYFLIAPLGFILYGLFLLSIQGDFLGMFHAYEHTTDWAYHVFNPNFAETIAKSAYQLPRVVFGLRLFDMSFIANILLPLGAIVLLAFSSIYLFIKRRSEYIPLAITGLLSLIMFTLNSNIVSVHRYVLGCLVVFVALALVSGKRWTFITIAITLIMMQLWLYILFILNVFVG